MTKRNKAEAQAQVQGTEAIEAQVTEASPDTSSYGTLAEAQMADPKALAAKTVVKAGYKRAYLLAAKARGDKTRAGRRGNGDWLQKELQAETIRKDGSFDLERYEAILNANGVEHGHLARDKASDIGRLRMSGGIMLRGRIGKSGVFLLPEGNVINVLELAESGDELAQAFVNTKWFAA